MPYVSRLELMKVAREVWEMAQQYKTLDRGEFTIDRLLFAYLRDFRRPAASSKVEKAAVYLKCLGEFPTQRNREFLRPNRELIQRIRDCSEIDQGKRVSPLL